jgi:hypothetical protein
VEHGLQVLGADRRQPHQPHSLERARQRREILATVNRDLVSRLREPAANLFVVAFNSAVLPNDTSPADERNPQVRLGKASLQGRPRPDSPVSVSVCYEPFVQASDRRVVTLGRKLLPDEFPSGPPHLGG